MESNDKIGAGYLARAVVVNSIAGLALAGVITLTHAKLAKPEPGAPPAPAVTAAKPVQSPRMAVSVLVARPGQYQAEVIGYGEAAARYALDYRTEVAGRVITLSDRFASGRQVKAGEVLARLDATAYRQALAQAEAALAQAELAYLEARRERDQARLEWQRSGLTGEPGSPLVLHEPQLRQAETARENARQALAKAQRDLDNTAIRAPFDALVVSRDIQVGSYLQAGGAVATLYSTDAVEVSIPLTEAQWNRLPPFDNDMLAAAPDGWSVELTHSLSDRHWTGYVSRVEQHLEADSRLRTLVVQVHQPFTQADVLYPGTFVTARIPGIEAKRLLQLPASAISQSGELWFVDNDNRLANMPAEPLFEKAGQVYIKAPVDQDALRVVTRPLNSYWAGVQVRVLEDQ